MKEEKEKRRSSLRRRLFWPVVFVLSLLWCTAALAENTVEIRFNGIVDYDRANQVVTLTNQQRQAAGLSALTQTEELQRLAAVRAMEIALYFDHTRPDGTRGLDIMGTGGTKAENLSVGEVTAADAVNGWMNSAGHKANILNKDVTQIGVGCFYANGNWWWVQLFKSGTGGSGTVRTGSVNTEIHVDALPSLLDLYVVKNGNSFSKNAAIQLTAGVSDIVLAVNYNNGNGANRVLMLYADSPGLTWKTDGNFTVTPSATTTGAYISGNGCGSSRTLTLICGTRTFTTKVSIAHNPEDGTNCTKDLKCRVCGAVVSPKAGHSAGTSCTEYTACKKCGQQVPPTGHTPGSAATCTRDSRCLDCNAVVVKAYGHNYSGGNCRNYSTCTRCGASSYTYGDHVWGAWTTSGSGTYMKRRCSVCSTLETKNIKPASVKVTSLKITGSSSVTAGKTTTLRVSVSPTNASNKAVTWSSSNTAYATVSSGGVVTAKAAGAGRTVTITAKAKDGSGKKATFKITIKKASAVKVKSVKITGKTSVLAGKKITLKATVSPSNASNKAVTWTSSNKKYATVSSKGVVTAKAAGAGKTVTITAKAKDGSGKKATFKVKIKGAVSKITLKGSKTLKAGKKTTIKAAVKVGKGGSKALTWSSSNKKYATVSSKGVVKALKAGKGKTVTITAKAKDGSGKKASIKIKIK